MIETTNEVSVRDRALAAWHKQQDEQAAQEEHMRRCQHRAMVSLFAQRLKEWFDVTLPLSHDTLIYELGDGIGVMLHGHTLVFVVPCEECGGDTPSWQAHGWDRLGQCIEAYERGELAITCDSCMERGFLSEDEAEC